MIIGHERQQRLLLTQLKRGSFSHAYLFTGASGIGKRAVAEAFAGAVLCQKKDSRARLGGCGECESCKMIILGTHPDLLRVESQTEEGVQETIGIDAIRALKNRASQTALAAGYKCFIVDDAAQLTREASNSLLKILEEPQGDTIFILVASDESRVLPTIRSRVWQLKFWPVPHAIREDTEELQEIATLLFMADAQKRMAYAGSLENDRESYRKVLEGMLLACKSALEAGLGMGAETYLAGAMMPGPSRAARTARQIMAARETLDIPYSNPKLVFESLMLAVV